MRGQAAAKALWESSREDRNGPQFRMASLRVFSVLSCESAIHSALQISNLYLFQSSVARQQRATVPSQSCDQVSEEPTLSSAFFFAELDFDRLDILNFSLKCLQLIVDLLGHDPIHCNEVFLYAKISSDASNIAVLNIRMHPGTECFHIMVLVGIR